MKTFYLRHGDVDFFKTTLPKGAKLKKKTGVETVAFGEETGHHHTMYGPPDAIKVWQFDNKKYYEILEEIELKHQQHNVLKIEPGVYEREIEREFDPFMEESRKVVD